MFIDKVKIYLKAGNGGDGSVNFHREKYVMQGGPDGGDGGDGGSIVFVADKNINTLIDFRYSQHFRAADGENGMGNYCKGKQGKDIKIKVPAGTVIRDAESNKIIRDMFNDGETFTILKGGRGGKGNCHFATSRRRTPGFAQKGYLTQEYAVTLELMTIADVGLVGFPNVGKSTLLSVISAARPKIANYHFTTLSPNLGIVKHYEDSFVVADIPGLIEGASEGIGLGFEFLRHIERVRLILHIVDVSGSEGRDPVEDYNKINLELSKYSEKLASLPQIIVANKIDMAAPEQIKAFEKAIKKNVIPVSAISNKGVKELMNTTYEELKKLPKVEPLKYDPFEFDQKDNTSYEIIKEADGIYTVTGGLVDALVRNVVLSDPESFQYFQRILKEKGVIKELKDKGALEGDTVSVGDIEFELID